MIRHLLQAVHVHLALLVAVCIAALLVRGFVRAERRGRGVIAVFTALGVVVLDAALYPSTVATQLIGIFHPAAGGQTVRLSQVVIALALVGRLWARGLPRWAQPVTLLWLAFFAWYLTAAVTGALHGYDGHLVFARAMFVLEAGGMILLASGIAARDFLEDRGLPRFVVCCAALAALVSAMSVARVSVTARLPGLPLLDFGDMGADAATLFPAIGLMGFAVELSRGGRRPLVLGASTVLVLSVMASPQRAARLAAAVALLILAVVALWPRRRRLTVRAADLALIVTCLLGAVAASVFIHSAANLSRSSVSQAIPFAGFTTRAISTSYRQGSIESRYNEWEAALPLVRQHPLVGNGLGATFVHYDVGTKTLINYDITNNIGLDLLLRTGAVGLALFVVALGTTLGAAVRVSRWPPCEGAAALAVTTAAVLGGLLAKAMVESVINEFRLTPLLGFLVGVILSLARAQWPSRPTRGPSALKDDATRR